MNKILFTRKIYIKFSFNTKYFVWAHILYGNGLRGPRSGFQCPKRLNLNPNIKNKKEKSTENSSYTLSTLPLNLFKINGRNVKSFSFPTIIITSSQAQRT